VAGGALALAPGGTALAATSLSAGAFFVVGQYIPGGPYHREVKPSSFTVGSANLSTTFTGLRWTDWGGAVATGRGTAITRNPAQNTTAKGAVTLTAEDKVGGRYTKNFSLPLKPGG
jgi:hypothetical protein